MATSWLVAKSFASLAILCNVASACECRSYRCTNDEGEFVFSPSQMLSSGALECIGNQTDVFEASGECRHCDVDCSDDICSCESPSACEWYSYVVVAVCYSLALALLCYATWHARRHCKERTQMRSYERRNLRTQRAGNAHFDERMECSIAVPLIVSGAFLMVGSIVLGARSWYLSS
mmetsp:Transcript_18518/g.43353  ORF Transcript_18518/g.43353 Transcript_18518/m.43353 type:complete len:177 (-) Transcript_18518:52-582(-)